MNKNICMIVGLVILIVSPFGASAIAATPTDPSFQLTQKGTSVSSGPAVCTHSFTGLGVPSGTDQAVYVQFYQQHKMVSVIGPFLVGYAGLDGRLEPNFEFNTIESAVVPNGSTKAVFTIGTRVLDTVTYKVLCP